MGRVLWKRHVPPQNVNKWLMRGWKKTDELSHYHDHVVMISEEVKKAQEEAEVKAAEAEAKALADAAAVLKGQAAEADTKAKEAAKALKSPKAPTRSR
jgi:regulator of protease activity HflC (stomatin/prohibitin superfamily)